LRKFDIIFSVHFVLAFSQKIKSFRNFEVGQIHSSTAFLSLYVSKETRSPFFLKCSESLL